MGSTQRLIPQSGDALAGGTSEIKDILDGKEVNSHSVIQTVREDLRRLSGSNHRFPGCQPVSMLRQNISLLQEGYMVSAKADGSRYLMYIAGPKHTFLINRKLEVYKVDNLSFPSTKSNHLAETLVDGELVTYEVLGKNVWEFLIYDIVSLNGDKMRLENFDVRYDNIKREIIDPRESFDRSKKPILISRKVFLPLNTSTINELLSIEFEDKTPYGLDGLIFEPIGEPYQYGTFHKILKWKPPSKNSIDFKLKMTRNPRVGELLVGNSVKDKYYYERFGTMTVTGDQEKLNNKIIECVHNDFGEWVVLRQRPDKEKPNFKSVADAVWKSIENPVTEDDLKKFVADLEKSEDAGRDPQSRKSKSSVKPHSQKRKDENQGDGGSLKRTKRY